MDLGSFSIYRPCDDKVEITTSIGELVPLQDIYVKPKCQVFFFDGTILCGANRYYLNKVPFEKLSIGGYECEEFHTAGSHIWIQSERSARNNIWFRLKTPASEYTRFYAPFLWLANLAKYLVDFLHAHDNVALRMFTSSFYTWLETLHGPNHSFQRWMHAYGDIDFRKAVAAHASFLQSQALQIASSYADHPLWNEVLPGSGRLAIRAHPLIEERTVVTPLVHKCFKNMTFGEYLKPLYPARKIEASSAAMPKPCYHVRGPENRSPRITQARNGYESQGKISVRAGDVVKLMPDDMAVSEWEYQDSFWYAYVIRIETDRHGTGLRVLWLYDASHTTCSSMHYPYEKELFLSRHCNCSEKETIPLIEVIDVVSVELFGDPDTSAEFFVRQTFDDFAFTTLTPKDLSCPCMAKPTSLTYEAGDTVLIAGFGTIESVLEPVELLAPAVCGETRKVQVRRLKRRNRDFNDQTSPPNELVYTQLMEAVLVKHIERSCLVRFYSKEERANRRIPVPYSRAGTVEAFYICTELQTGNKEPAYMQRPYPASLRQGFDPLEKIPLPIMNGLDLFCGGGSFGRGIEEGGAVRMKWALDIAQNAMHTYRANVGDPDAIDLFLGSVNDYLANAIRGDKDVARPGDVDVIVAGSPCVGFSIANLNTKTKRALRNSSLVASVVSFVDFYRPKYGIFENVTQIAKCAKKDRGTNVFSQMTCALVAMGYQVMQFSLDAWSFGDCQSRSRLFIAIAAPGLEALPFPVISHSHPRGIGNRSLG